MAVRRVSATLARTQELPYTTFLNSTIELIQNPDALAVYTYLQTKSEHWIVRREDVMKRFGIGKHRYAEAMSHLRGLRLVERLVTRDSEGKVTDNQLVIHYQPNDLPSGLRVSGNPDERESSSLGHLETDQSFSNESIDSNNSMSPTGSACSWCVGLGYHGIPEDTCNHCQGTGREPTCNAGLPVVNSELTTEQPKPEQPTKPEKTLNVPFGDFWNLYGKKVGRKKSEAKWKRLTNKDRAAIMEHLPNYIRNTPDVQYRKNPETYLNAESWNDELPNMRKTERPEFPENQGVDASIHTKQMTGLASELTLEQRKAAQERIKAMIGDS